MKELARRVIRDPRIAWFRGTARYVRRASAHIGGRQHEILGVARQIFGNQIVHAHHSLSKLDRSLLLQGRLASFEVQRRERIRHLGDIEFRIASQWGEDGIIEWLCHKIGEIPRSFIEFGVENFSEANTRFLIENRGWKGLILDGNAEYMSALRSDPLYWRHDLTAVSAFVTAENINALIAEHGFTGEIGILSIDIDGNDYWVLDAIHNVNPAIIICEVNGVFGDLKPISVPYRPDFQRLEAHYSGQYFGCSIAAARQLCERKGFTYVGTNTNGVNAFFIRNELAAPVVASIAEIRSWPQRHRDSRSQGGELNFVRGCAKKDLIAEMPVVDLANSRVVALGELDPLYSDRFLEDFR